eukprot:m.5049 g.5049  ORF g.5049 m.5049 type:complete len:538 (+) comp11991_c0_seq1:278-1891(+)
MAKEDLRPFNISALVIAAVFVIAGLPVWWKTTTVYRAPLPLEEISKLNDKKMVYTVTLELIQRSGGSEVAQNLENLLQKERSSTAKLKILYKILALEPSPGHSDMNLPSLNDALESHEPGHFQLYELASGSAAASELQAMEKDVWLGSHGTVFVLDLNASVSRIAKLISNWLVCEPALKKLLNQQKNIEKPKVKSMTAVQSKPGYQLSFSLLNPDPGDFLVSWNIKATVKSSLFPFLQRLSIISDFSVDSQILRYADLGVTPKHHSENKTYYLSFKDLPHSINVVESRLGTYVSSNPTLEFLIYVPRTSHSPLFIQDKTGQTVPNNAFLSPRWGGIVIHNGEPEKANRGRVVSVPMAAIMPIFISQLKLLLGLDKPAKLPDGTFLASHPSGVADWEMDGLMLRRCIENVVTASAALTSLTQLLEKVKNMVIADHIQTLTVKTIESIDKCLVELESGHLVQAFLFSKTAIESAETAFYDPSMLELLYFPEDQKFAIYVPLFVPVGVPVLLSVFVVIRRWKKGREEPKPTEEKKEEQTS